MGDARGAGAERRTATPNEARKTANDERHETNASGLGVRSAPDEATQAIISRSASPIIIDGVLEEPDWKAATPIEEIRQREPHEGQQATESTEVKLLYDSQNFYIGVMCFDTDPKHIIGTQMSRDADLFADDRIEILIDSFRDRRNAYYFATNPLDVRPYLSHKVLRNSDIENDASTNPGTDIFYNITPSLKWTTTINTDLAETEVDMRREGSKLRR